MAANVVGSFDAEVRSAQAWMASPRFEGITRLYSARQVVEQRGVISQDHTVARVAADRFYARLREMFEQDQCISTFGPYSPGQAVAMKRAGIEGIYLGGWATSAKGSQHEDPGPDLASYPLSMVPDEAAAIVRALLTADRNQRFARSRLSPPERQSASDVDFTPSIIADADTGHGGDPHVRNLIRRFVEAGVPGYHIEDQKPGAKKCGHQGGKVLVPCDEQIKRLNAARFQLDVMGVAGIIVARTDAEAANLLDGGADERDQPFIMGATQLSVPSYKDAYLAVLRLLAEAGVEGANGYVLYSVPENRYSKAIAWLDQAGVSQVIENAAGVYHSSPDPDPEAAVDRASDALAEAWHLASGLATYAQAVADQMALRTSEGESFAMGIEDWLSFARTADTRTARDQAVEMGLDVAWDPEVARTTEGYYQVQGGIPYAVAKSLAVAPYCDLLWMETKTADLEDARMFAEAVHAVYPDKMLAYNLSPSFNWDTTGMSDEEMRQFPAELGRMGFVFNFITYGGHQVDGIAGEEFAASLQQDGMLALARLQRKLRLVDSPYRTPQTLVGGPRLDAALMASSGRTATTRAMGKGSTQFQHLVQTEVPTRELEGWLERWAAHNSLDAQLGVRLRPYTAGSEILELAVCSGDDMLANVVFGVLHDRRGRAILSVRDQNTHNPALRRKRLMALMHLYLIRRYDAASIQYLTPTEDNYRQASGMKELGLFASVSDEVGEIIVADVDEAIAAKMMGDGDALQELISGRGA